MYATLMVHLELTDDNAALLRLAADLAGRFDARVTGVCAVQPLPAGSGMVVTPDDVMRRDLARKEAALRDLEKAFREALQSRPDRIHWRAQIGTQDPIDFVVREARTADLVVTRIHLRRPLLESVRRVHTADLAIRLGRPVLAVPPTADRVRTKSVLVGWKDTPEARRAVTDALPLLKLAERVTVAAVALDRDRTESGIATREICEWLATHGVAAQALVAVREDAGAAGLAAVARDLQADLIVAGAYGHSRFREWVLGGVTRELLTEADRCLLLSH